MRASQPTQNDVAQLAGVTRATVSYVLNGRGEELKITPGVIKRVNIAARKLNYRPNFAARTLAGGRSYQLALFMRASFVQAGYWSFIASGIERAALAADYDVILLARDENLFETAESYLVQSRADAVLLLGDPPPASWNRLPVPPVVVGGSASSELPRVVSNMKPAIDSLVEHLVESRVRQVTWIGPLSVFMKASVDRLIHLRTACTAHEIELSVLEFPNGGNPAWTVSQQIENWRELIESAAPEVGKGSALVCWNDFVALGAYGYLHKRGLQPGRDVAVVGFDNQYAEAALPALASIGFNTLEMGKAAVRIAIELIKAQREDTTEEVPVQQVPAKLHTRASLDLTP